MNINFKSVALAISFCTLSIPNLHAAPLLGYSGQVNAHTNGLITNQPVAIQTFDSPLASQRTTTQTYSSDLVSATSTSTAGGSGNAIFASSWSNSKTTDPAKLPPPQSRPFQDIGGSDSQSYVNFYDRFVVDAGALNGTRGTINFSVLVKNDSTGIASGPYWSGSYQWAGFAQFSGALGSTEWRGVETYNDNYNRQNQGAGPYHTGGSAGTPLGNLTGYEAGLHNLSLNIIFGQAIDIHMQLQTWSSAMSGTAGSDYKVSASSFDADLGLLWGGISYVYDANGNEIGSYSARSNDSGINYASAYTTTTNAVPEPASIALLSMGLLGIGCSRRRKSCC